MHRNNHKTNKLHIRKGDLVKILSGNSRGRQSRVLKVLPKDYKAIVEGVNIVMRHRKPTTQRPQGGIEKIEAPIHISNLMVVEPDANSATRVGRKIDEEGKLVRYSKKTGNIIKNA